MNPKSVLFIDFDGTICHDKYWRSLPREKYEVVQNFLFGKDSELVRGWLIGKYTAEEINRLAAEKASIPYEYLWKLFVTDCESMHVPKEILLKIDSMRDRFTVVLATGNMDSFTRFTLPALQLDRYFDRISNTFSAGKLKDDADGGFFTDCAKDLNVSIKDCILIDNSAKACDVFAALGGRTCLIKPDRDILYFLNQL